MNHSQPTGKSISILLVEDERISREILGKIIKLKFPDLKIFDAENGKEGLDAFKASRPDIVITDISMPVMDGVAMATEILQTDRKAKIIITTAHGELHGTLASLDTGSYLFLQKPIKHELLFKAIQAVIDRIPD